MAGETSGPGPSEQEIRMVALERKFDELLSFVQLIAKRNPDDENQRKEDDRDANNEEPEGHSNTNATPPPPTPPKPEGKDSHMSWFPNMTMPPKFKAPEFEKYNGRGDPMIHLQMYCRKMAPYADNEPLLIQTFQDTLTGTCSRMVLTVEEDISLEGAGRYLSWLNTGERIEDALKTKKIVDMTALMALVRASRQEGPDEEKGRGCANDREKQWKTEASPPNLHHATDTTQAYSDSGSDSEKSLISPVVPRPYNGPQRKDFNPNSTCDFHFGEVGHTVENCNQLKHRVQDLIDHGVLKFEGLPNITTNPLPNHPEGGRHITPLEAPPGPSTGDACEYHSGARGHSLECCEEFKKEVANLTEKGLVKKEEIPSGGDCQSYDPSDLDWYAELNLDDIVEDEMDLDNLQDEGDDWGYFMEDDTDEWRNVDFTKLFQFPCLIVPPGFETPEFEIFYENGDPEVPFAKVRREDGLTLGERAFDDLAFLERYRFNPHSILEYLGLKEDGEPYVIPDPGVNEVIVEIKEESSMSSLPALTEGEEEEKAKPLPPAKDPDSTAIAEEREEPIKTPPPSNITTTTAEEEYAGPMVEGLSIHTIAEEEDSTTPPTRHCQQGEEAKMWTCVPLLQRVSRLHAKPQTIPTSPKLTTKTNCSLDNIDNSDEEIELPNDILEALERQDEGSKPNIEELEIINLADEGEEPREVKIGTRCTTEQKEALIALLREFHEIFAWSYQDMPGLDTDIVVHKIPLKPECKPVKQALRRMKPEVILKDQGGSGKAIEGRFPKHSNLFGLGSQYSPSARKRMEKLESTNAVFSFMDGFSGYNQIKMAEEDKSKTAFVTHWGTFVYDVMPFGLKNAGATYQRAMVTLFHDMIHHEIEVYVDDMIAKSRTAQDHLTDLRKLFQRLKKGIEIDPAKVQAIRSMPAPKTEKEIRSFLGRINYIARFIAQLTATCEPLFKLLRKDVKIKWTEDCQRAFDKIKEYLLNPPILVPPTPGRPLILYLTVQEASMGCMLGQQDETGKKEQAIYYLSKKFTEPETRYLLVEKTCCALAWASKKLRQYMLYYTTWLVSRMDPIKYIFEKPALTGKIARWQTYPSEQLELMDSEFPDEDVMTVNEDNHGRWKLYFDGAANSVGSGIGAVLVSPKGQQTPIAVKLGFDCTNNMTEYEACIVVSQTNGEWQARDPKLIPYQRYISRLVPKFKYITFTYTPRAHNHFADALATLASLIKLVEGDDVRPLRIETRDIPAYCVCVEECMNVEAEIDNKPWYYDIKRFIQDREYPPRATENEKKYIRRMAFQFFLSGEILYKRTHDATPPTMCRCGGSQSIDSRDARGIDGSPCQWTLPGSERL
uniref:Reverse transcriptase domain-containing protein n=1 Tax=Fagus sylvatica TaxID=28930 RepID=A0A2N9GWU2_FAGSY